MKQAVVDRYVEDIAYTLGVPRDSLNIVSSPGKVNTRMTSDTLQFAAAKGLIAGAFTILRENGSPIDYGSELEVAINSLHHGFRSSFPGNPHSKHQRH